MVENKVGVDVEECIAEMSERKKCESRLVVFNVPESKKKNGLDRKKEYESAIVALIEDIPDLPAQIRVNRVGKQSVGKTRPILLDVGNPSIAREILKRMPLEGSKVRFKSDQTKKQRDYLAKQRSVISKKEQEGDFTSTIRYINGLPKIVKKTNFQQARENQVGA